MLGPVGSVRDADARQQPGRIRPQYAQSRCRREPCQRVGDSRVVGRSALTLAHPPLAASGTMARLCNQHLPPLEGPPMPVGRFTLVADFVLDTTASGICNAHAVADFSPDTSLPAEWVRMRDPFQGVSKRAFGFSFSMSAAAP